MNFISMRTATVALNLFLLLAGCGGGGGGATPPTSTPAVFTGVMAKGSVIVNGVRFEDNFARIMVDDTAKTAAALQDGMIVKLRGHINDDRLTGAADEIEVENEVRGTVQSTNAIAMPLSFTLLGQTVLVDDLTVFAHVAGVAALVAGSSVVEVHGQRDGAGNIRASRVELIGAPGANIDELRGVAASANGTTFTLAGVTVDYATAIITPTGATLVDGALVEVHGAFNAGTFAATRVDIEDSEDIRFAPGVNDDFEVEGYVSGFGGPGDTAFSVSGVAVTISSSTRYISGISTDLGNNIKVEAEGVWNGTSLAARKIEFKRSVIRLQGAVTTSGTGVFVMDIAGHNVGIETNGFTNGSVPAVGPDCVQIRGQRKAVAGVVVMADEIGNCSNSGRPLMQAPVDAESAESTISLLGFVLDVSNPTDTPQWVDVNNQAISRTAFFSTVAPANAGPPPVAGTLVKAIFNTGANTIRQVEIED
jgi:hypothetical protein